MYGQHLASYTFGVVCRWTGHWKEREMENSVRMKWKNRGNSKNRRNRRWIYSILAAVVVLLCTACGDKGSGDGEENGQDSVEGAGKHHVEITVKDYGTISVELDGDTAPITVANFLKLAEDGFYDGLTFHRVIANFMIQGGDPLGTGMGGSEETIKGEFSANGVTNDLLHTRGAISMARSQAYDSASSQFFIVREDSPHLNGKYACFGYVTSGMEVVDAICEAPLTFIDSNGGVAAESQPVIESIKVID